MFMLKARSRVVDVPGVVWALTRSLFIVAVMLALLVSAGVAYAQGTPTVPTIESVAVTSDPGEDGGYDIGDEIQARVTFRRSSAAGATLTHAAMTFASHKIDNEITRVSNIGQTGATDTITTSEPRDASQVPDNSAFTVAGAAEASELRACLWTQSPPRAERTGEHREIRGEPHH